MDWIKELVRSEEQMEQAGLIDFSPRTDTQNIVLAASIDYLKATFFTCVTFLDDLGFKLRYKSLVFHSAS